MIKLKSQYIEEIMSGNAKFRKSLFIRKLVCIFFIALLISGCATPFNVTLKPRIDRLGVRQLQLNVALVVPSSIRKTSFSQQDSCAGKTFIFQTLVDC